MKGVVRGRPRGWLLTQQGTFRSDRARERPWTESALRRLARVRRTALTYTCVPPGSGERMGIDRDADGALDGDELRAGTDPADPRDRPRARPAREPREPGDDD